MRLQLCSVADVTLRVKATQAQATGLGDALWYGGSWMKFGGSYQGTMYFRVVPDGDGAGLRYWTPGYTRCYYTGYSLETIGLGVVAKEFIDGELDCTVRFVTDVTGIASVYIDGVLLEVWDAPGEVAVTDLVSGLYHAVGWKSVSGAGYETCRLGGATATVWDTHVPGPSANWKVRLDGDGNPAVVKSVAHNWTDWVAWVGAAGDPDDYEARWDLYAAGDWDVSQVAVDTDGCFYGVTQEGDTFLSTQRAVFEQYRVGAVPNLSITHHTVSNTLLVTDAGLAGDGSVGMWKVQRKA